MKNQREQEFIDHFTKQSLRNESSLLFRTQRTRLVFSIFFIVFAILLVRAGLLLVVPPSADILNALAERQYNRSINLAAYRGTIFDRRQEPLAISIRKPSLYVNPRVFSPSSGEIKKLSKILNISAKVIKKISSKKSYFAWLKRKVDQKKYDQVSSLNIKGLNVILEQARYYPSGLASQLIGYVGTDNKGLLGLELRYNQMLMGDRETNVMKRDAKGRIIHNESTSAAPQKPGHRIHLTIDRVVQEISEQALERGVRRASAKSGFVIVSDPHTGHVLAMANYPKFDPNNSRTIRSSNTRNFALLDLFEPGSVVKPFVIAKALQKKKTSLAEAFEIHKGIYRDGSLRIRDSHPAEELSTEEILIESSNIGTYKIAERLGREELYKTYVDFGLGEKEFLINPKQQSFGRIDGWQHWKKVRFANISFGQGLLNSGLEITQAYGAIANGGQLMRPVLINKIEDYQNNLILANSPEVLRRVLSQRIAKKIAHSLEKVVQIGTGKNAASVFYSVAGKTGTSEKADPITRGYSKDLRIASFAGFSPVSDPHLVIYVVVDEPGVKPYYGGTWAAPVFKEINERSLRYLNVAPDLKPEISHQSGTEEHIKL